MAIPNYRYGQQVRQPDVFLPSFRYLDKNYSYQVDLAKKIVKRTPLLTSSKTGSVYLELLQDQMSAQPKKIKSSRGLKLALLSASSALMLAGLYLVLSPLYPKVQYQVSIKPAAKAVNQVQASANPEQIGANRVVIPKIGVRTPILESPNLKILNQKEGVWHQTGGIPNNLVLAGHRFKYLPPNTSTFFNLDKLLVGDSVIVDWLGKRYIYQVSITKVVTKYQTEIIMPSSQSEVTLYTCDDKKQTHRIVVVATLVP